MGFRINTNVAALTAHNYAQMNNRNLNTSLERLSSGLRINHAADDASGLAIADSLRAQGSALGQAIANANDGIGMVQTADGALDEYGKILDKVKTKAVQAASDGQNASSRLAIQKDIDRLMEEANNIAKTTSFNGLKLLSGAFQNKEIQVGAYAHETVKMSIASATTDQLGHTVRANLNLGSEQGGDVQLTLKSALTGKSLTLRNISVKYDNNPDHSMGALADEINRYSGETGIKATAKVSVTSSAAVTAGTTGSDFAINGITIGTVNVSNGDQDGALTTEINKHKTETGVEASLTEDGKLKLTSTDGRAIKVTGDTGGVFGSNAAQMSTIGHIELVQQGSGEFQISGIGAGATGADIKISSPVTTTKDSVLAAGSTIGAGSKIVAGSTVGGDAKVLVSNATGGMAGTASGGTQLDTSLKAGSTIAYGSTISTGTTLGGQMLVGSPTAGGANTNLTQDMLVTSGSTLKSGSVLGKGTVITTEFTEGSTTYHAGDTLTSAVTLSSDLTLTANMTLKYDSDANSSIATESTINTGSQLGADFHVGLVVTDTNDSLPSASAASTSEDYILDADTVINYSSNDDSVTIKEGSLLTSGSTLTLENTTSYAGPDLVTTTGVIKQGDDLSGWTSNTQVTLQGDQILDADLTTGALAATDDTLKTGSIIKSGFTANQVLTSVTASTGDTLTGSKDMTVAEDMTLKAGSDIRAGSTLMAGTELGDNTYVYGTGTDDALSTYLTSDIKAGSVLEDDTVLAEGSTIGGTITITQTTLESDMTIKAGSTLKFVSGANNTMLKAGTVINQDMTLNTANDGSAASEVEVHAGDVLTDDLYLDADTTLSADMLAKEDSVLAAGTTLAVNTENSGTVGLSDQTHSTLAEINVLDLESAMKAIDTLDSAIGALDTIRSDLGSVQNQLTSTINNISTTQVNVKAAESQIRDVDFAAESANFSKYNILAQSGSYAMSQANAVQQNVMRLLQ